MRLSVDGFARSLSRKAVLATAAVGAVALVALGAFSWKGPAGAPVREEVVRPARVAEVQYRTHMGSLMLAGTVVPRIETTLGFRVAGKVTSREVDVGAVVQAGQLLARIDPTDYRLAVDNARAALASAEADYARAKADLDRYQALRGSAAFMTQTLDTRQSVSSTSQAKVEQAKSQLATAENNLAYTELHADAAGVITAVIAEVGQVLPQGQGMVKLARSEELEILVGVPENRLKNVREASRITFELWSDTGRRYKARLRELSPSADPMTRTYPARFTVVDAPDFIGIGMTASLTLAKPDPEKLAEVPLTAIFQKGKEPAVWVVDKQTGAVALRSVTISRWRDETALLTSGVEDGEIVATAGVHKLEPGQKVKPLLAGER
ncbi:MAG: efflux RND transporter periplasmic adaptor subunit [Reyranella sp.]|uniref:efflux RND transporter periplasmic adaptor subunit n=1 Tax=Reyranella sp. TaxID=1929291 RepID=UPI001AD1EB09|nr:efflux RND transporter periplasmic adaptor subunit [Reyranella sp.]MBN9087141.1 efflux RND transporter periplasmic adaptor subunit [Reyranella sp.]